MRFAIQLLMRLQGCTKKIGNWQHFDMPNAAQVRLPIWDHKKEITKCLSYLMNINSLGSKVKMSTWIECAQLDRCAYYRCHLTRTTLSHCHHKLTTHTHTQRKKGNNLISDDMSPFNFLVKSVIKNVPRTTLSIKLPHPWADTDTCTAIIYR